MNNTGFSLLELLVAFTVCALLSGAVAAVVPSARAAFDSTPDVMDQQQRERTLADVLGRAIRSAALLQAIRDDGTPGVVVPAVKLLDADESGLRSRAFRVLSVAGNGRGVLAAGQEGSAGGLQLQPDQHCPATGELCGFSDGATAVVVDAAGRFDVFAVAAIDAATHVLVPSRAFATAYPAGSAVFEVASDTYRAESGADGSSTLVRETAAGAVQPMVDHISEFSLEASRLADRLIRVDITVRLGARTQAPGRQVTARLLRLSVALRNPS